jgi:multiple sugar transport system ATP-binding protein
MAKVIIKNLFKKYGNIVAINDLSIDVNDGEFLVLLGPSGCGKTTTLRCIAGLEKPDKGEIYIGNRLVNDLSPKDRNIAMVFQSYALYPHMNVFDNIAFPLKMRKVPENEIKEKVKRIAQLLRITHLLDRRPRQLSGGEAQRVALARALVRNPDVFLLDEPLSNLDAKLRIYMRAELKKLQKNLGVTTIYVTHDQAEAMTMADRIAVLNLGVLQQLSTPYEAYNNPQNLFVASFIGSPPMNLIECTFIEKNGKYLLETGVFTIILPETIGDVIKDKVVSTELVLGVRPEDIIIFRKKIPEAIVEGEVYLVEPLGSDIIVDLKIDDHIFKVKTTPDFKSSIGDKVWISFEVNKIHVFDKKTEKNLI